VATRTQSADPRAERVRAKLIDAAFALAHESPVDQLTVGDLVARAGVSRQVFYRHFADRDDAVATAFVIAFAAATADVDGEPRSRILRIFGLAAEHRAMYRNVVPSPVAQKVVAAFRGELLPACEELAARALPVVGAAAGLEPGAVSRFLVGGFQEVLRSWMEDPSESGQAVDLVGRVTAALDTVDALLSRPHFTT
jgi:AcrR family transcriptional regulator